ncbi:Sectered polysaccharide deacetylase [Deinococcus sp.]|uniref:YkoP family protein n=1 Tax=Deinococcus sp. TaxID=47478 RepID=UPI0025B808D4|nr:Sectered polysaccharide deacetylase [Deinococcus sp.]
MASPHSSQERATHDRPPRAAQGLLRLALRAGVGGAWHGGHLGVPQVGLLVPVADAGELQAALTALAGTPATLLVPPALALLDPRGVREAVQAGHELAGQGDPAGVTLLEATAGQAITDWAAPDSAAALRSLLVRGLRPLPATSERPEPGSLRAVRPADLNATLTEWRALGYRPVPLRDLPGRRAGTPRDLLNLAYTRVVEDRFTRAHGVIDLTDRVDAVLRVAPLDHAPPPLPLPPGTPTAELHLHSPRTVGLASRNVLGAYRAGHRSLKDVGRALRERPELESAQAVFAVTLFHRPLEQAGFTLLDLPPARACWYGLGFRLLRGAYGTIKAPSEGTPKMGWMPREAFLRRYG